MDRKQPIRQWYERRSLLLLVMLVVTCLVNARSLQFGLFGDDYAHRRFILDHLHGLPSHVAWWNMFDGRSSTGGTTVEPGSLFGRLPWWSSKDFSFALLRPLSTASQFLDYLLWPSSPWAMHLHNIVLLCVVVLIAGDLYWRLLGRGAWLALFTFALDDAHTMSAAWIASRNTLLTTGFVLLTLWLHRRAAVDGLVRYGRMAPIALLCAHASSEGATIAWAYLLAHAAFLDSRPFWLSVRSLLPMATVTALWLAASAALGYGVRGSAVYVDPRHDVGLFLLAVARRLPELMQLQFAIPPEFGATLAPGLGTLAMLASRVYAIAIALCLIVYARRSAPMRFFAFASVAALLPQCAAGTFARLLLLSGFAAHGLMAAIFVEVLASARRGVSAKIAFASLALTMFVIHAVVAVQVPSHAMAFSRVADESVRRAAASLPAGAALQSSTIVALNFPDYLRSVFIDLYRSELFGPGPQRMDFIEVGVAPVLVTRPTADALQLEAAGGFLLDATSLLVRRPSDTFRIGQRFALDKLSVEVVGVTSDGRPARIRVRSDVLDDPQRKWLEWSSAESRFKRFALPAVGGSTWLGAH